MNEWKNIIMLHKTPIHVLVCKVRLLDFRCYFETNSQNHIHFRLIQVLKNSMAWHIVTFTSQAGICISAVLRSRRANVHLLVKFNAWTSQRVLNWNPVPKITITLIWKTPVCLKFGKISNRVENLPQRKLCVWAANDARFHPPTFLVLLFELFVAQCILVKSSAVHSG